jgi:thymidylate kinase
VNPPTRTSLPRGPRGHTLVDATSTGLTPVESALGRFFRALERRDVPVLALRGARRAPHFREVTDLDIACMPRHVSRVEKMLLRSFERFGVIVVTRKASRHLVQFQVYAPCGPGRHHHLCIDISTAQTHAGVPYLFPADLFRGRDTSKDPHRPSQVTSALIDFMAPYLGEGEVDPEAATRLVVAYEKHPAQLRAMLGRIAGTEAADRFCAALRAPGLGAVAQEVRSFRRALVRKAILDRPIPSLRGWVSKVWGERLRTVFRPWGMTIAVMGAEGSGKSTLAHALLEELSPSFRSRWNRVLTFREIEGRAYSEEDDAPGRLTTWTRATRMWLGIMADYYLRTLPLRRSNTVVLFDRWIDDWLVEPERYGLRPGSRYVTWLVDSAPRPDVVLVTSASVRAIARRRPDLSTRDAMEQVDAYEDFAVAEPHTFVIPSSGSLDDTVDAAVLAVLARSRSIVRRIPFVRPTPARAARAA